MTETLSPLLTLLDANWDIASHYIAKHQDREWTPQFIAETASGERLMFLTPWRSEAEKAAFLIMLGLTFREKGVKRYVLSCEAWMAQYEGPPSEDLVMPSERPDRIEILQCIGVDAEAGEILQYHAEITRVGRRRKLGERRVAPYNSFSGRMTELLGPVVGKAVN
jgi:hypothetical protein